MASSSSTLSSSSQSWDHDVFLSFRGEDTRKTFVDHLYTALVDKGINTYKDDETLPRGESISPALLKAIRESRIAVIVFSENYANSSWCLDELAYIMNCKDEIGQIVVPIFYHVDPSDIRNQKGKYGEAFPKYESENNGKAETWRKALSAAGNLSGWVPNDIANGHESKLIQEIVDEISRKLCPLMSSANNDLIGIDARVQDLELKLEIGSDDVLMIGIWGVGGGGKTTLASSIYDKICHSFDGCCFIENIKEECKKDLKKLQEKILSSVVKQNKMEVDRVEEGRNMIKSRLRHRKVLIVLDDVDHINQLRALAGSRDWFGKGSRIIITTRDENILNYHKVNVIHNISLLKYDEAIELFCKHAPRNNIPVEEYERLSKDVVSYSCKLPLALKVLGRHLCDKEMKEWKSALGRLKEIPDAEILETLKISYDRLNPIEKELFLEIACFFRHSRKESAMKILDACGFHPDIGVKVLVQKALITLEDEKFNMHDLIQEMAHYIVRWEHPNNPEKHSRVWKEEDVRKLCVTDATMTLDNIEAITVYSGPYDPLPHNYHHVIENMKKLRWIEWEDEDQSECLWPTNFPSIELRCLILKTSHPNLWKGYKYLPNLRMIKLEYMSNLIETPDLGGLPNLERFELIECGKLEEIHPSIGGLERLVYLTLIIGCHLGDVHINSIVWDFPSLKELDLSGNDFSRLDFSILRLPGLKYLNVSYCHNLIELSGLPSSIAILIADYCESLESVGDISNCKWLWNVSMKGKNNLDWLRGNIVLHVMLQGNAIDHHFINFLTGSLDHIPRGLVDRLVEGKRYRMELGDNWYNHFSGFIVCIVDDYPDFYYPCVEISIRKEVEKEDVVGNFIYDVSQEFDEEPNDDFREFLEKHFHEEFLNNSTAYIGYVSFDLLMRDTTCFNSPFNTISISLEGERETWFVAELVPRKSNGDQAAQITTDSAQFYDVIEHEDGKKAFNVQHHSKSSIDISWIPVLVEYWLK